VRYADDGVPRTQDPELLGSVVLHVR
jgi:hypothetical protein